MADAMTPPSLDLDGVSVPLAPLALGAWKRFRAGMQRLAEGQMTTDEEVIDFLLDVVAESVRRGGSGITRDVIEDALDFPQAMTAYTQVLALSVPPAPPGEPTVASQPGASTGT